MFQFKGQKVHSSSWAMMVKRSKLRTELGLRMRKGKTVKDRLNRGYKNRGETANG